MTRARRAGAVIAAAAGLAALLVGCAERAPHDVRPALILVTLDTFRADHLGCAGNPVVRTPHLDRLARRGLQWTEALSPIPLTTPSHATILSGMSPRSHGLLKNRMALRESVTTLAEVLAADDWRTGAVVSSPTVLGREVALDQGFDTYEVVVPEEWPASGEGARTTDVARAWLDESGGPGSFLWVHYFDAHLPYLPPAPLDRLYDPDYAGLFVRPTDPVQEQFHEGEVDPRDVAHLAALYAGEVTFLDRCVGRLLRADAARDAVVLVTADHGEGLWEHDRYFGHDLLLYDTSVRVPLLLAGTTTAAGLRRDPARTMDVAPTFLALADLPRGAAMEGRDLLHDPEPEGDERTLVLETHPQREKSAAIFGIRTDGEKVIWVQRERRYEYYDLAVDPAEQHDLGEDAPERFRMLAGDLDIDLRERPPGHPRTLDEERGGMDQETRDALQSLGYVN